MRQQGFVVASWQSGTVVFQCLDIESRTRHDAGQLCAHMDVTGGESSPNMVCLKCENLAGARLKVGAEAYLLGFNSM